jgi:hypothetical protein
VNARRSLPSLALLLGAALAAGCGRSASAPPPAPPASNPPPTVSAADGGLVHLPHAQPRLPTVKLWLGTNELVTELALSRTQIATGMMFRESMKEEEGMLFVFARPNPVSFYMKNVKVPLSVAYIDQDGTILEIHDFQPFNETPVPSATDQVQYVLEVNRGWFQRRQVGVGAVIRTDRGTMRQTFFPRR